MASPEARRRRREREASRRRAARQASSIHSSLTTSSTSTCLSSGTWTVVSSMTCSYSRYATSRAYETATGVLTVSTYVSGRSFHTMRVSGTSFHTMRLRSSKLVCSSTRVSCTVRWRTIGFTTA